MMRLWLIAVTMLPFVSLSAMASELRSMQYTPRTPEAAIEWQQTVRKELLKLLHMTDLVESRGKILLEPRIVKTREHDGFVLQNVRIKTTHERSIGVVLARPIDVKGAAPAVVCIHGHGGDRYAPFDPEAGQYKLFGTELVRHGFVVISADIGQHEVYEDGRTLMGERLWDLMRCVDYLESLPEVDSDRIGCAGLSLGGEMAMWLGAMDTRIAATASAGFLTFMDQMEQNHCMCWKFDGLHQLVDFPDIYSLIAPRPLQCQNGRKEPPTQFTPALAQEAMKQVLPIYRDFGAVENAVLEVHDGGHEIALEQLLAFFSDHLAKRRTDR
jgi:hypothetical protein